MAKPSKGIIIALVVCIAAALAIAGGWWYIDKQEREKRAAAFDRAFKNTVKDAERAGRAVKDSMESIERLKEGR